MRKRLGVRIRRGVWQVVLACLAFVQVIATFRQTLDALYVVKWLAGIGILLCYFLLARGRVSSALLREFTLIMTIIAIGMLSQLGDNLDSRAIALGTTYTLTAVAGFLIGPAALRRKSVHRTVWPAMLVGVAVGTLVGELLGILSPLTSISMYEGRWRFFGAFFAPNTAGTAGLVLVIIAGAAFRVANRLLCLAAASLGGAVMVLASSRGSLLAAGALALGWLTLQVARWPLRRMMLGACGIALLLLGIIIVRPIPPNPLASVQSPMIVNQLSSGRWTNWSRSLSYLSGPLDWAFGLGLSRNFSFIPYDQTIDVPVRGSNADNFYVDLLGRTGLVGLLLFLTVVASLALRMARGLRTATARSASDRTLGLAVLAATLALGVTNSVILTWAWLHAMVAWPLIAAVAARPVLEA